tara:strand:- start:276 stop:776 length:501 start_codon:yes stop_codon:yes gene_type:complete
MSNNLFYKALAAVSTAGIVLIAGIQVTTALKKGNNAEDQLAKTIVEIKNARRDALAEVKSMRSALVKELNGLRSNTLSEVNTAKRNTLAEVKEARNDVMKALEKAKKGKTSDQGATLILIGRAGRAIESIQMNDMNHCEEQGALWKASKRKNMPLDWDGYECLESN